MNSSNRLRNEIQIGNRLSNIDRKISISAFSIEDNNPSLNQAYSKLEKNRNYFLLKMFIELKLSIEKAFNIEIRNKEILHFLLYCLMWTVCIITVFNGVKDYLKFEVVSQTRIHEEIPASFPTVTICSLSTFSTNKASNLTLEIIKKAFNTEITDFYNVSSDVLLNYIEIARNKNSLIVLKL